MPRHHSVGALFLAFYEASGKASSKARLVVNLVKLVLTTKLALLLPDALAYYYQMRSFTTTKLAY